MKTLRRTLALIALSCASMSSLAGDRGYLGLAIEVDGDGIFNPTLKQVTVSKVAPGSPAAAAGLAIGDRILEIEGRAVPGSKAKDLQAHLQVEAGQTVRLVIKPAAGEPRPVTLVAAPK